MTMWREYIGAAFFGGKNTGCPLSDYQKGYDAGLNGGGLWDVPSNQQEYDRGKEAGCRERERREHAEEAEQERREYAEDMYQQQLEESEALEENRRIRRQIEEALDAAERDTSEGSLAQKAYEYMQNHSSRFDGKLIDLMLRKAYLSPRPPDPKPASKSDSTGCLVILGISLATAGALGALGRWLG